MLLRVWFAHEQLQAAEKIIISKFKLVLLQYIYVNYVQKVLPEPSIRMWVL